MNFLGRWFSDALRLALSLTCALLFMQAPALSHDYQAALAQVADAQNRDISARQATARSYYKLPTATEDELFATLREREPSNFTGLVQSRANADALAAAFARIAGAPALLTPVVAAWDLVTSPDPGKRAVAEQAVRAFVPALQLTATALIWALAGVILGSFVAQLLLLPGHRASARLSEAR